MGPTDLIPMQAGSRPPLHKIERELLLKQHNSARIALVLEKICTRDDEIVAEADQIRARHRIGLPPKKEDIRWDLELH